jgi:hypothetical protein
MTDYQPKPEKDLVVTMSNLFAHGDKALFKKTEKKVTWLAIAFLKPYEFPVSRVSRADIRTLLNISENNHSFNSRLEQMAIELRGKTWLIPSVNDRGIKGKGAVGLFDKVFIEHFQDGEYVEFTFSDDMREHVLNIASKRFFKYHVYHRLQLETDSAESLFDYIMTQHFKGGAKFEIVAALSEQEKEQYQGTYFTEATPLMTHIFGFQLKGAYQKWSNIRDKQVNAAIRDINENTDLIDIEPEWTPLYERKTGRGRKRIVGIRITVMIHKERQEKLPFSLLSDSIPHQGELLPIEISESTVEVEADALSSGITGAKARQEAKNALKKHGITLSRIAELLDSYTPVRIFSNLEAVQGSLKTAKNPAGLIVRAIENDFAADTAIVPPSGYVEWEADLTS